MDLLVSACNPAREQDAVAGPGWHLPVLSYRLRQSGHTPAGREKAPNAGRARFVELIVPCTRLPAAFWLATFVPRLSLPHPSAGRGEHLTGKPGKRPRDWMMGLFGREPELQPRKGTHRQETGSPVPTVMLHLSASLDSLHSTLFLFSYHLTYCLDATKPFFSFSVVIEAMVGLLCDWFWSM